MKKLTLITLLYIINLFSSQLFAQDASSFAPPSAEWWHRDGGFYQIEGLIHASVITDTVIADIPCKKVNQVFLSGITRTR